MLQNKVCLRIQFDLETEYVCEERLCRECSWWFYNISYQSNRSIEGLFFTKDEIYINCIINKIYVMVKVILIWVSSNIHRLYRCNATNIHITFIPSYWYINVHNWLYYISIIHFVNYKPSYIYDQIFLVTSKPFSV